jgi:hypothetical protein
MADASTKLRRPTGKSVVANERGQAKIPHHESVANLSVTIQTFLITAIVTKAVGKTMLMLVATTRIMRMINPMLIVIGNGSMARYPGTSTTVTKWIRPCSMGIRKSQRMKMMKPIDGFHEKESPGLCGMCFRCKVIIYLYSDRGIHSTTTFFICSILLITLF